MSLRQRAGLFSLRPPIGLLENVKNGISLQRAKACFIWCLVVPYLDFEAGARTDFRHVWGVCARSRWGHFHSHTAIGKAGPDRRPCHSHAWVRACPLAGLSLKRRNPSWASFPRRLVVVGACACCLGLIPQPRPSDHFPKSRIVNPLRPALEGDRPI
jgi:hypothetical protein